MLRAGKVQERWNIGAYGVERACLMMSTSSPCRRRRDMICWRTTDQSVLLSRAPAMEANDDIAERRPGGYGLKLACERDKPAHMVPCMWTALRSFHV